jgi:hypothetical protein
VLAFKEISVMVRVDGVVVDFLLMGLREAFNKADGRGRGGEKKRERIF